MADLFPLPAKPPRAKPRVMAHVVDAGCDAVSFVCMRCGWESGWITWESAGVSDSEAFRRGIPCPECAV